MLKEDILKGVRRLETIFWCMVVGGVLIMILGVSMIGSGNEQEADMGVFIAIEGLTILVVAASMANTQLAMYWILRERQKSTEDELRRSEAADL